MATLSDDETPRQSLSFGGQFLLWSVRLWVHGLRHQVPTLDTIDTAYSLVGCPEGATTLTAFMTGLSAGARRKLDIRPPCFRTVSADEDRLLTLIRSLQTEAAVEPRFLIAAITRPDSHARLLPSAERLAQNLLRCGLSVQGPISVPRFAAPPLTEIDSLSSGHDDRATEPVPLSR